MKKLKFAAMSLLLVFFISCSTNGESNGKLVNQSAATRMYFNALKEASSTMNEPLDPSVELCFTPTFPIDVFFNNGNKITINSMNGLKEAMYAETQTLHINSIDFPFNIIMNNNGNELTVQNEEQFLNLLVSCTSIDTIDHFFSSANCFEFVFPLSVVNNSGNTIVISDATSLNNLLSNLNENEYWTDFIYPFQVIYDGNTITINDIWDFYIYVNCNPVNSCFCPLDIEPVCVETPNGIVQFDNTCWAQCAGYTSEDFAACSNDCVCTEEFIPVCVQTSNGIVQFENACKAQCAGYSEDSYVPCN